ncbi:MAG TPA: hypothetical protein VMR77_01485, partial [Patescibacteria group bacterium]|nr:hypothetical protein [Patescibacteria group bacterium]
MVEKFENSFRNGPAINPSIHDCKIIEPKGMSRMQKAEYLGLGTVELAGRCVDIFFVAVTAVVGLEMIIAGIGENCPAELTAGIGTISVASIISRLANRVFNKSGIAFAKIGEP